LGLAQELGWCSMPGKEHRCEQKQDVNKKENGKHGGPKTVTGRGKKRLRFGKRGGGNVHTDMALVTMSMCMRSMENERGKRLGGGEGQ